MCVNNDSDYERGTTLRLEDYEKEISSLPESPARTSASDEDYDRDHDDGWVVDPSVSNGDEDGRARERCIGRLITFASPILLVACIIAGFYFMGLLLGYIMHDFFRVPV